MSEGLVWLCEENEPPSKPIMARAFDGSYVPAALNRMNCGGVPLFDRDSGMSYRCNKCWAVIGSVSQPQHCKNINN